ncbi:hypothetical protein O0235_05025 [Tepidiforma flava]|jgi:hypothetical protein|uniref:ABC transporter permease n=1 Tax=Tepidiforma flava TaxID=3004094 RepID=A0ABY7MA15_9CHLR|nr:MULTISPECIES: hypothetical protein [Tepidiforma]MCX7618193.1 hypothetical protein [Tepidiforma sp.]WBL36927.1 hypothetical protein O0235_05025 [Tepidiforma flava]GIW18237.1 MAG: hypothetical protein KatS3mg064_1394 [Tepidiforma sp.]
MKSLLAFAIVTFFAVTIVMAVVFRDRRARDTLRFLRNVAYGYIIAIVLIAAWRLWLS